MGAWARKCLISDLLRSPSLAPIFWTTDIELIGAQSIASFRERPRESAAIKVEENASPAPVRSNGARGSGYGGMNQTFSPIAKYAPTLTIRNDCDFPTYFCKFLARVAEFDEGSSFKSSEALLYLQKELLLS